MVMFEGRSLAHLCALNPDSPATSTAFVVNSRFVPASLPVGYQKQRSESSAAMSNPNGLLGQNLCHYLNEGRTLNDILMRAAH